jgi:gas vesicle protein
LGAAVGSLVALLYAPASGAVTRKRLGNRIRTMKQRAVRRIGQTQKVLVSKAGEAREAATEWITDHMPSTNGNGRSHRRPLRHAKAVRN